MQTYVSLLILTLVGLLASKETLAGDGDLDKSFGDGGKQAIGFDLTPNGYDSATGLGMTSDGKIYLVGTSEMPDERIGIAIGRLLASGEADMTFGVNGKVSYQGDEYANIQPVDGAVLPNGRLLIAGIITRGDEIEDNHHDMIICRFLSNGNADVSFGSGSEAPGCVAIDLNYHDRAKDILVQRDGKIVIAGFTSGANIIDPPPEANGLLVRLSSEGILDESFGESGLVVIPTEQPAGIGSYLYDVQEADNGDLIATGESSVPQDHPVSSDWRIYRLDSDGEFVMDFGDEGVARIAFDQGTARTDAATAARILQDGSIVIAGYARFSWFETRGAVVLLTAAGNLDTSFGDGGKQLYTHHETCQSYCDVTFNDMIIQSDGKIIIVGSSDGDATENSDLVVLRLTSEGEADPGFGQLGWSVVDIGLSTWFPSDRGHRILLHGGRALIAGAAYRDDAGSDMAVARLESDLIFTDDLE